jgi:hypothetical protein
MMAFVQIVSEGSAPTGAVPPLGLGVDLRAIRAIAVAIDGANGTANNAMGY